jgi:hypothetical protein
MQTDGKEGLYIAARTVGFTKKSHFFEWEVGIRN